MLITVSYAILLIMLIFLLTTHVPIPPLVEPAQRWYFLTGILYCIPYISEQSLFSTTGTQISFNVFSKRAPLSLIPQPTATHFTPKKGFLDRGYFSGKQIGLMYSVSTTSSFSFNRAVIVGKLTH